MNPVVMHAKSLEVQCPHCRVAMRLIRHIDLTGMPNIYVFYCQRYWHAVPERVWEFYIGGYQVLKKWLSYREEPLLGRALTKEEAREVTGIARRVAAVVLMTDELDANYVAIRDAA
jgi:Type ISP C-terminal specificity domain